MKVFNIVVGSLVFAVSVSMGAAIVAEKFLDKNTAMFVVVPVAMILGMNSRRIVEKFLGYTLLEAMKEGSDESNGN